MYTQYKGRSSLQDYLGWSGASVGLGCLRVDGLEQPRGDGSLGLVFSCGLSLGVFAKDKPIEVEMAVERFTEEQIARCWEARRLSGCSSALSQNVKNHDLSSRVLSSRCSADSAQPRTITYPVHGFSRGRARRDVWTLDRCPNRHTPVSSMAHGSTLLRAIGPRLHRATRDVCLPSSRCLFDDLRCVPSRLVLIRRRARSGARAGGEVTARFNDTTLPSG